MPNPVGLAALTACACLLWQAQTVADDKPEAKDTGQPPAMVKQPMEMDEPMDTGMMKQGMKKGDVKKAAEKHKKVMDKMLKEEERSMPSNTPETRAAPQ